MASSSSSNPILYSCIAYNNTILAEHTASASSQASSLASLVLPKIDHSKPQKLRCAHGSHFVDYIALSPSQHPSSPSTGGLTFLSVVPSSLGLRLPFEFLLVVQEKFLKQYDPQRTDFGDLPPYGCAAFNATLKEVMRVQGTGAAGADQDALKVAREEIDSVRHIMTENIERVFERGERINLLVDKTDRLGNNARDFRVRSRGLRRRMWWKNVKLMALLVVVVIFLLYLFVGFGCGLPAWSRCMRH